MEKEWRIGIGEWVWDYELGLRIRIWDIYWMIGFAIWIWNYDWDYDLGLKQGLRLKLQYRLKIAFELKDYLIGCGCV